MKTCKICGVKKSLSEFSVHSKQRKDGTPSYRLECKPCRSKLWRENNKRPEIQEHRKKIGKSSKLKKAYGINLEQFLLMLEKQNYQCGIPGCPTKLEHDRFTHVDHDHSTGKIRKLLCNNCNLGLGHIKDSIAIAEGFVAYLKEHQ